MFCKIKIRDYLCTAIRKELQFFVLMNVANAKIAQLVEHNLAKVGVAGSSPVFRSKAGFGLLFLFGPFCSSV